MSRSRTGRLGGSSLVLPGESPPDPPLHLLAHLSGPKRGVTQELHGDRLRLGTAVDAEVRVSPEPTVAPHHALLERRSGGRYELVATAELPVWVNGEAVRRRQLANGDLLEIGRDGPLLRYRLYPAGTRESRSIAEAFADGFDPARRSHHSAAARTALGLLSALRELLVRGPLWLRILIVLVPVALIGSTLLQQARSRRLAQRLALEEQRVEGLADLLEERDPQRLGGEIEAMQHELAAALDRLAALEARTGAPARVLAAASPSVTFLQGSYGFDEPRTGRRLRFLGLDASGSPIRDLTGEPIVGFGGDGPEVEIFFTGTAFLVDAAGLLLTNRHLAVPWDQDAAAQRAVIAGLRPALRRFLAYLPGFPEPFEVRTLEIATDCDLALLQARDMAGLAPPLALRGSPPRPGQEVLVLGYPAGIQALLARADDEFVAGLRRGGLDFWQIAYKLAEADHIGPLASRGIVAQVSPSAVVYDAETTQGGSGGPVLALDGTVVAVTSAIVTEFGGSNLGVPAARGQRLLAANAMRRLVAVF